MLTFEVELKIYICLLHNIYIVGTEISFDVIIIHLIYNQKQHLLYKR